MTLGGYRRQGCQVTENAGGTRRNASLGLSGNGRRRARGPHQNTPIQALGASGAGAAFDRAVGGSGGVVERTRRSFHNFARDHDFFHTLKARKVEHRLKQDAFENGAQATRAGLALDRLSGNRAKRLVGEGQLDILHLEQPLILLDQRVLRIGEDLLQRSLVQVLERGDDRQTADEFGDQAVLQEVFRFDVTENLASTAIFRRHHLRGETDRGRTAARRDDLLEAREGAAADEEYIGGVYLQELLLRMLAAALRGNRSHGSFRVLQQCLPNALARHIAGA